VRCAKKTSSFQKKKQHPTNMTLKQKKLFESATEGEESPTKKQKQKHDLVSVDSLLEQVSDDWKALLKPEMQKEYFQDLLTFLNQEYASSTIHPDANKIFSCFSACPFSDVRVVILGQVSLCLILFWGFFFMLLISDVHLCPNRIRIQPLEMHMVCVSPSSSGLHLLKA
jgi:hypothetical protein